jgi:hypothetical protein
VVQSPRLLPGSLASGKSLSLEMLRAGWVTTYEQAGAEYGQWGKDEFLRLEAEAKSVVFKPIICHNINTFTFYFAGPLSAGCGNMASQMRPPPSINGDMPNPKQLQEQARPQHRRRRRSGNVLRSVVFGDPSRISSVLFYLLYPLV